MIAAKRLINHLTEKIPYPSIFADVVKQLTSRHILHNHEKVCGCAYHLVPETYVTIKNVNIVLTRTYSTLINT